MGTSSTKKPAIRAALPLAPWIYINDPANDQASAFALSSLIPLTAIFFPSDYQISNIVSSICSTTYDSTVSIVAENQAEVDNDSKIKTANELRKAAIVHGNNFASVNLFVSEGSSTSKIKAWGTNHLELCTAGLEATEVADKVYKWLFSVLTVPETLHLIPESEMLAIDKTSFPDYQYCPIADSRKHPKDAKIQFVALITSKPSIGPGQRISWTVADRTGVANFYFEYRDSSSQYTWEWVLALKPGERKALPRMPCVEVVERRSLRVLKSPFRGAAFLISGTGTAIKAVGRGVGSVGGKLGSGLGKGREWVPQADTAFDARTGRHVKTKKSVAVAVPKSNTGQPKTPIKVFNEKGVKLWRDDDSVASTTNGDTGSAVTEKEFL